MLYILNSERVLHMQPTSQNYFFGTFPCLSVFSILFRHKRKKEEEPKIKKKYLFSSICDGKKLKNMEKRQKIYFQPVNDMQRTCWPVEIHNKWIFKTNDQKFIIYG